jgi:outer membrane protein assembly factor BamB
LLFVALAAVHAADAAGPLQDIRAAGRGVCVQIGGGDGALLQELAQVSELVVHALERDDARVQKARADLRKRGLYGRTVVERSTSSTLPYADNLVNFVVAENAGGVSDKELLRVLAPGGSAWIKRGGEWKKKTKALPREFDEWTHRRHGADGNNVSRDGVQVPTGLRWVAGPAQDAGGKEWYHDHLLLSAGGRNFYIYYDHIAARDSYNGHPLWQTDVRIAWLKETSVAGWRKSKVSPVATAERLYVVTTEQLVALDTATGATVQTLGAVQEPRELLVAGGLVLIADKASVRAYNPDGQQRWIWPGTVRRIAAGDERVFCLIPPKSDAPKDAPGEVACLDLSQGKERWRVAEAAAAAASSLTYGEGVLVLEKATWKDDGKGSGVAVLAREDGKRLWALDYEPGQTHYQEARSFIARGLVWLTQKGAVCTGYDPKSGEKRKQWKTCGKHCSVPVASEKFLIAAECEFTNWENGEQSRARMFRSACRNPFVPANGLLNTFPLQCECFPMLRGYMGLAHDADKPADGDDARRLEKGPAYGRTPGARKAATADEWPMYRRDNVRSGSSPALLKLTEPRAAWQVELAAKREGLLAGDWQVNPYVAGALTAPVSAGGLVLTAVPDAHLLTALDAKTGAARWSFTASGRIDTPPTVFEDLCLFGAHDGCVYAVALTDGQLAWRFLAAPRVARIMAYGQMESPWPVAGSVLVDGGLAYVAAGRHPASDGGVFVYALNPRSGEVAWQKTLTDVGVSSWYGPVHPNTKVKVGIDFEPVDLFVKDGDRIAMSRWRFNPQTGEASLAVNSILFEPVAGLSTPRGLWSYGIRQTKMVERKAPAVFGAGKLHTVLPPAKPAPGAAPAATVPPAPAVVAFLLVKETLITARADGTVELGGKTVKLEAPVIHDGLIAAYGCIYAATANGRVVCIAEGGSTVTPAP